MIMNINYNGLCNNVQYKTIHSLFNVKVISLKGGETNEKRGERPGTEKDDLYFLVPLMKGVFSI